MEVKSNIKNSEQVEGEVKVKIELEQEKNSEQDEVKIVAENKLEQPKQKNYFIKRNNKKIYLNYANTGNATVEGQFLGELFWYGKVLYTNGVIWKYYTLSKESGNKINGIRKDYISNPPSKGEVGYKTWIFEQCKETLLIISADIGDLTEIYEKIKDKTSIPTFDSQDYR